MRVTVLGSGSDGNATLVESDDARVLIDAGFSGRSIEVRMRERGVDPEALDAIVITHDHIDHTRGMGVLARRFGVPLHLTERTRAACASLLRGGEAVRPYASSVPFRIGSLRIDPFLTVHDAVDPVAVTVTDERTGCRLGIATDLGRPTAAVRAALAGCHMLVLESNHDEAMLRAGPYPWSVKQRIASSHGHLSNTAAGALARELCHEALTAVVLAHLSEHCNDPGLAFDVTGECLGAIGYDGTLEVAGQDRPLMTVDVARLRARAGDAPQLPLFPGR
jgi:phosphoribosyl 1,2-cyclic phosphodiesterase